MNLQKILDQLKDEFGNCDIEINIHGVDAELMLKKYGMDAGSGCVSEFADGGKVTIYSADYLPFQTKSHFGGGMVE